MLRSHRATTPDESGLIAMAAPHPMKDVTNRFVRQALCCSPIDPGERTEQHPPTAVRSERTALVLSSADHWQFGRVSATTRCTERQSPRG
jgi:hypothetical protein